MALSGHKRRNAPHAPTNAVPPGLLVVIFDERFMSRCQNWLVLKLTMLLVKVWNLCLHSGNGRETGSCSLTHLRLCRQVRLHCSIRFIKSGSLCFLGILLVKLTFLFPPTYSWRHGCIKAIVDYLGQFRILPECHINPVTIDTSRVMCTGTSWVWYLLKIYLTVIIRYFWMSNTTEDMSLMDSACRWI